MKSFARNSDRPGVIRLLPIASIAATVAAAVTIAGPASAHETEQARPASASHSRDGAGRQLADLKKSLAVYQDVAAADAAGFVPVSECTVSAQGGMGMHYLNPALAGQAPDATKPAILLYAPTSDGAMRLLGAEWFQADADQDVTTDEDRPTLFGRPFDGPMPGHDPGMPVHYDLHVWLYDSNPAGVFAPWNPSVGC